MSYVLVQSKTLLRWRFFQWRGPKIEKMCACLVNDYYKIAIVEDTEAMMNNYNREFNDYTSKAPLIWKASYYDDPKNIEPFSILPKNLHLDLGWPSWILYNEEYRLLETPHEAKFREEYTIISDKLET